MHHPLCSGPPLAHLQHGVQHVDFAGLLSGLGQRKPLRGSHPGNPLDHSLNSGEIHQHVLVLRTQPTHTHCIIERLTQHLCGEAEQLTRTTKKCAKEITMLIKKNTFIGSKSRQEHRKPAKQEISHSMATF